MTFNTRKFYQIMVFISSRPINFESVRITAELVAKDDRIVKFWVYFERRKILESIERHLWEIIRSSIEAA